MFYSKGGFMKLHNKLKPILSSVSILLTCVLLVGSLPKISIQADEDGVDIVEEDTVGFRDNYETYIEDYKDANTPDASYVLTADSYTDAVDATLHQEHEASSGPVLETDETGYVE